MGAREEGPGAPGPYHMFCVPPHVLGTIIGRGERWNGSPRRRARRAGPLPHVLCTAAYSRREHQSGGTMEWEPEEGDRHAIPKP